MIPAIETVGDVSGITRALIAIVLNLLIPHEAEEAGRGAGVALAAATVAGTDGLDDEGRAPEGRAIAGGPAL